MKSCILVVGMHRSGTSALTGLLDCLGFAMPPVELIGATPSNMSGHFEPASIVQLHDRLLARLNSGWPDCRRIPERAYASEVVEPFRRQIAEMVSRWVADGSQVVIKDPRICRLLPLWRSILAEIEVEPLVILAYRNPISVAHSLAARDGFIFSAGLHIWLRHLLDAEADTRTMRRTCLRYEVMLADWRGELRRVITQLGLNPIDPKNVEIVDNFLDVGNLNRSQGDDKIASNDDVPSALRGLLSKTLAAYELLRDDPANTRAVADLITVRAAFDEQMEGIGDLVFAHAAAQAQLEERRMQIKQCHTQLQQYQTQLQAALEAVRRMEGSRSWRLTAPLRGAWNILKSR